MFATYILASQRNGTLYVGMTDDLARRTWEHKEEIRKGFTAKYCVKTLVYFAWFETRAGAFCRERAMKKWRRARKLELIERFNPCWEDRLDEWF